MDAVATAKLALDASGMDRGLASAQTSLERFSKSAAKTIAAGFTFTKIIQGFSSAIEKGDQLQDIAEKFGVSASKLQMLGNAASVFGSNVEQVSAGLNKISLAQQKAISGESGSESLVAAFDEVGISMEELRSMSAEDIFLAISDSFASGANDGRQFVIVNELLGKAQTDLIKVLNQGSAAITEQGNAIGVFSDQTIAQLSAASDSIKKFQNLLTVGFGNAAAKIMEAVESYGRFAAIKPIIKFFDETKQKPEAQKTIREGDLVNKGQAEKEQKEAEKIAKEEATQELKIIDAEIQARRDAEKILQKFEEDEAEKKLKRDKDRADELKDYRIKQAEAEEAARRAPRLEQQARGGAATEVLDFAAGLGDRGISQAVAAERAKAGREQQKANRKEFDQKVLSETSATTAEGLTRTMTSRRQEFIKKEAGKEAKGGKSLSDIYQVLNDALSKITAAPMVT
jgi:hypothetical protein